MQRSQWPSLLAVVLGILVGCGKQDSQQSSVGMASALPSSGSREAGIHATDESVFSKITIREGAEYQEGIVDAQGNEVVQSSTKLLVIDITGPLALIQFERKFLFVPLDQGFVSASDLASVNGFQYAEPYRCGLALVSVGDARFYINAEFENAFDRTFEFAESFHGDRALVKVDGHYQIIDNDGRTLTALNFDQVNPQSPWCWQVTRIENERYRSGFIDLNGTLITDLIYDYVGYYDPAFRRTLVVVKDRYGFVDEHANQVIPAKFEHAEVFINGKAKVVLNGRVFLINRDGTEVSESQQPIGKD